jgi:uncharacterized membrane protein
VTCEPEPELAALERAIGRALGWGTIASSVCLAAGLVMMLTGVGGAAAQRVAETGLVVLIATPVVRVIISLVQYLRERDWLFVTMTAIVLLSLAGSVAAAFLY